MNVRGSDGQYITMSNLYYCEGSGGIEWYSWPNFSGAQRAKCRVTLKIRLLLLESSWELISSENLAAIMHKQISSKRATVGCLFNLCAFNHP